MDDTTTTTTNGTRDKKLQDELMESAHRIWLAGLGALRWLSSWLESGKWQYFGYYCLAFALLTGGVAAAGG